MFQVISHQDSAVFTKLNDQQHINHNDNGMSRMLQNFTNNGGF
jgi:hypothetical protein